MNADRRGEAVGGTWRADGRVKVRRRGALAAAGVAGVAAVGGLVAPGCGWPAARADRGLLSEAPLVVQPAPPPAPATFAPIRFPEDEEPHGALAEWWYYTGHLDAPAQPPGTAGPGGSGQVESYGFQFVFFRGIRAGRPPAYAAHFAITDLVRRRFRYDQRADVAVAEAARPQPAPPAAARAGMDERRPPGIISWSPPEGGFDLAFGGWRMRGRDGQDSLAAAMPGYRLEADLAATRPPALHLGEPPQQAGVIPFGPGGYSYYYSRTRMALSGTLAVEDRPPLAVRGEAWMDHQWGDFVALGWGGWDWFGGQLVDGRDIALFVARDPAGATALAHGTLVDAGGAAHHLAPGSFTLAATGWWTSPRTGVRYPSGWRAQIPGAALDLLWAPVLDEQELDTRATTGVVYWEGANAIRDAASGELIGRGYVELTGYTPAAGSR